MSSQAQSVCVRQCDEVAWGLAANSVMETSRTKLRGWRDRLNLCPEQFFDKGAAVDIAVAKNETPPGGFVPQAFAT